MSTNRFIQFLCLLTIYLVTAFCAWGTIHESRDGHWMFLYALFTAAYGGVQAYVLSVKLFKSIRQYGW